MSMTETALEFFEACETGKGWEDCAPYCHDNATFSSQADTLAEISSLEAYANWMRDLLTPVPDMHYDMMAFAADDERSCVLAAATFKGTQTGPGPVDPPTGKPLSSHYAYVMEFDGDRIRHMTKIWNDVFALRAVGWA